VLSDIKTALNDSALKKGGRYDIYDFISGKHVVELKSRRCFSYDHRETVLPKLKLNIPLEHPTKTAYFFFKFNDELYYIKYDKELFDTFTIRPFVRNKREGCTDLVNDYIHIPVQHLTKAV